MYCQACGAENTPDARFCNMCGARFAQAGEVGGPLGSDTDEDPRPATGGPRNDPNATVLGVGQAEMAAGAAPVIAPAIAPPPAAAPAAGAPVPAGPNPFGGDSMLGVTLGGIGVKSAKKTWVTIAAIAVVLVAAGSLATWLAMRGGDETAGHAEADDPFVLGMPLTEETETLPETVAEGDPTPEDIDFVTGAGGGPGATPSEPDTRMRSATRRRSTSRRSTGTTTTGGGTTTMTSTGGTTGTSGGTSAMTETGTGSTTMESDSTTMEGDSSATMGGGSLPSDVESAPEERDLELELYGSRVRYVVRRYYATRAQSCFDRATRNDPTVSGTVVIAMSIGADGQVSRTSVQRNTTGNETLGNCLSSQVRTWRLPPPPGGSLDMTMPFSR